MLQIVGKSVVGPFGDWLEFEDLIVQNRPLFTKQSDFGPKEKLKNFVSPRFMRRLDHFTLMTLLGGHLALEDMKQNQGLEFGRLGIVLTSGYGPCQTTFDFLDGMIEDGPHLASPLAFSHSVHNVPTAVLAMSLEQQCPCTTICQPYLPVSSALVQAEAWLHSNLVDTVLLGAVDEDTRLLHYCLHKMRDIPPNEILTQEGAVFFCLQKGRKKALAELSVIQQQTDMENFSKIEIIGLHPSLPIQAGFCLAAALVSQEQLCIAVEKSAHKQKSFIFIHKCDHV